MATPPGTRQDARARPVTWLLAGTAQGLHRLTGFPSPSDTHDHATYAEDARVTCLARGPGDQLLAGTFGDTGLLKSVDGGDTWRAIQAPGNPEIHCLTVVDGPTPTCYAGARPARLLRSLDAGASWQEADGFREIGERDGWMQRADDVCVRDVVADPADPNALYVAVESAGVYHTGDGGETWTSMNEGLANEVHALAIHPEEPEGIWAATAYGIHRSEDAGESWRTRNEGLRGKYVTALAVHPERDPDTAYCAAAEGPEGRTTCLFETTDAGNHWRPLETGGIPAPLPPVDAHALTVDPTDTESLFAGTRTGDIWTTRNLGESWHLLSGGLPTVHALLAVPFEPPGEMY